MKKIRYRIPDISEFIPGFKCETNYGFFSENSEWVELIITEDFLNKYLGLIMADAYLSEFRVKI